ncbi:hypothetical protein MPTK1_5g13080 [Marchantia polymorpha subsp. ruderalis]|nr:hypothetical protein AXG93_1964s1000 [Marchantia polymorpha subsp. ruderalis]PTQ41790.1 hypothetical protein MARPO_0032s0002 [Marchantia polymorpha]BBN11575.1 hypothetical protein Mp_5g13080 [Marchantia polymorpha subsp. ruderalis]|eukprot:PTQ41790.1 hypothetical protein MARPO_0032s0002 [Marchantia polymorpha]
MVRAAEVRTVVEQIIGGLQGSYAAAAVAAAFASGAAAAAAAEAAQEGQQGPSPTGSKALPSTSHLIISKGTIGASSSISRQFRADVLRETCSVHFSTSHSPRPPFRVEKAAATCQFGPAGAMIRGSSIAATSAL